MTLADKRKVIEVLLCTAQNADGMSTSTTWDTAALIECVDVEVKADACWSDAAGDVPAEFGEGCHGTACLEAAYRLIESSRTLRREWFGGAP